MASSETPSRRLLAVGAVGLAIGLALAIRILAFSGWDPTAFVNFAADDPGNVAYAETLFDAPEIAEQLGHDGRFFFAQAMDPLYIADTSIHVDQLDRPRYRAQRMLYPTMAWALGVGQPNGVAWSLVGINLVGLAVGVVFLARLAMQVGLSRWFGLIYLLNVGIISSFNIDGSEIWALNFVLLGILATYRRNLGWAVVWLSCAVLTRETVLISVVGLAIVWWRAVDRRQSLAIAAGPIVAAALWWLYLRIAIEDPSLQDTEALSMPFVGLVGAFQRWLSEPFVLELAVALLLLVGCVRCSISALRHDDAIAWSSAGYLALALVMSEPVWTRYFDFSRILAPVFVAYLLVVFTRPGDRVLDGSTEHRAVNASPTPEGPA